MKIFFSSTEDKLPLEQQPHLSDYGNSWHGPWVWVVHPGLDPESFLEENATDVESCIDKGGALLFISGSPRCGLSEQKAQKIEAERDERVHFLRSACTDLSPNSKPSAVVERILRFLKLLEGLDPHGSVPWSEVEPGKGPENLLAVYLLLKALETCPSDDPAIRKAWDLMDPAWKRKVWEKAWREYHEELKMDGTSWKEAGLPAIDGELDLLHSSKLVAATATIRRAFAG
jgi:hypothetical protein